jgi:hypothetical protein
MARRKKEPEAVEVDVRDPKEGLEATEAYMNTIFPANMKAADRARVLQGMAQIFVLINRISNTTDGEGKYFNPVNYQLIPGKQDWSSSCEYTYFPYSEYFSLQVTINGEDWIVNASSEQYVFDRIHEMLNVHDKKLEEGRALKREREKALDKARSKLTARDLELLGLK